MTTVEFDKGIPEGGLLQTAAWCRFQRRTGAQTVAIALPHAVAYGFVRTVHPLGVRYLYVPRGVPNIMEHRASIIAAARRAGCSWVRVEPLEMDAVHGLPEAPHIVQPPCVLQLSLHPTKDELLANMKSKTRYNIRLALRRGVDVSVYAPQDSGATEALEEFIALTTATAKRKHVRFHDPEYYRAMVAELGTDDTVWCRLYVARYEGTVLAANIVTHCNGVATYLHGATSDAHRSVMAPFALQYRAICDAKDAGCTWYDFGGMFVGSDDAGKRGITRFKMGFAPNTAPLCVASAHDIVLSAVKYRTYRLLRVARSMSRLKFYGIGGRMSA